MSMKNLFVNACYQLNCSFEMNKVVLTLTLTSKIYTKAMTVSYLPIILFKFLCVVFGDLETIQTLLLKLLFGASSLGRECRKSQDILRKTSLMDLLLVLILLMS
jgi:hypothetical protein